MLRQSSNNLLVYKETSLASIQFKLNGVQASLNMLSLNFQSEKSDCLFSNEIVLDAIDAIHQQVKNAANGLDNIEVRCTLCGGET